MRREDDVNPAESTGSKNELGMGSEEIELHPLDSSSKQTTSKESQDEHTGCYEPGSHDKDADGLSSDYDETELSSLGLDKIRGSGDGGLRRAVEWRWMGALFWLMFLAGWSDASTGPLLLRIQSHYQLSYPIVSLIFVCAFIGFALAAGVNVWVESRWGFGKAIGVAAVCQTLAFSIQATKPPFPIFLLSFIPNGLGMGLQDANANAFTTRLPSPSQKMSLLHAVYGLGAFVTPLVGTQFAREGMRGRWEGFYLCSVLVGLVDVGLLWGVFRGKREERLFEEQGYEPDERDEGSGGKYVLAEQEEIEDGEPRRNSIITPPPQPKSDLSSSESSAKLRRILTTPFVHVVALFTWIYVGIEVTIGGWAVTYLVQVRGAGDDAGYASSGFFGGLMIGRVVQIWVSTWLSEQMAVLLYTGTAGILVLIIWHIPSVMVNAVAYAITGLVLGPIYPIMMNATAASLDPDLAGGAIGYIAALGQCGSALFPWITGALAGSYGVWALQPLLLAMIFLEGGLWVIVVRMSRDKWKSPHRF